MLATNGILLCVRYDDPAQRDAVFPDHSEASSFQYSTVLLMVLYWCCTIIRKMQSVQLQCNCLGHWHVLTDSPPTRNPLWRRQYV